MSHEIQIGPQVDVRWGSDGGGVCRCIMYLHSWGYLWWHHCGWANAPKCGGRDRVGGGDISTMHDSRGNVSGQCTAPYVVGGVVCVEGPLPPCAASGPAWMATIGGGN